MSKLLIQDARLVAYRALCLGALLKRGELELTLQYLDDYPVTDQIRQDVIDEQQQLNAELVDWLQTENLTPYFNESEQLLLNKPLGTWTERNMISTSWRVESLGVLLWSLEVFDDIPPYDTQFDPSTVLEPLQVLTPVIDFVWRADLRDFEVIHAMREVAELWNWRSRATELERMGVQPPEGVTFQQIIRMTAEKAHANGGLPHLIDGDFPVFGRAYACQTEDEYSLTSAIAYERYSAMNWLCDVLHVWE